jgi:hypothetical protein
MKLIDIGLFTATLILLPFFAWICGRAMGRRDWPIWRVIVLGGAVALALFGLRLGIEALLRPPPLLDAVWALVARSTDNDEVGFFFVALAIFMAMIGWTSTPVSGARRGTAKAPRFPR